MKLICDRSHGLHLPELGCYGRDAQISALEERVADLYEDAQISDEVSTSIERALRDVGLPITHKSVWLEQPRDKDESFTSIAIRRLAARGKREALGDLQVLAHSCRVFVQQFTGGHRGNKREPDIADWKEFFEKLCP